MASGLKWTNEEWRRLQTSLFSVTGTTRIRLSELTSEQWEQVVRETRRSREDIDAALDAMLRRQELPGGRVPVQTTERLFREAVPLLRKVLEKSVDEADVPVPDARLERVLLAIEGFNFATLPYQDLFLVWNHVGKSEGLMECHECLRCVYSVLGQITHSQVRRMDASLQERHQSALAQHRLLNPPSKRRSSKALHPPLPPSAPPGEPRPPSDALMRVPSDSLRNVLARRRLPKQSTGGDDNPDIQDLAAQDIVGGGLVKRGGRGMEMRGGRGVMAALSGTVVTHDRLKVDDLEGALASGRRPALSAQGSGSGTPIKGGRVRPSSASRIGALHTGRIASSVTRTASSHLALAVSPGFMALGAGVDAAGAPGHVPSSGDASGVLRTTTIQQLMGAVSICLALCLPYCLCPCACAHSTARTGV